MTKQLMVCLIVLAALSSCNQNNVDVKEKFGKFKTEFLYFSSIRDKIFRENIGCHAYSAKLSIREELWQDCNAFSVDSGYYFQSNFLSKIEASRLKSFMGIANVYAINFVPDSVMFYFRDGASQMIFFTEKYVGNTENIEKIESNFYCADER
jgi:hypothetical protein